MAFDRKFFETYPFRQNMAFLFHVGKKTFKIFWNLRLQSSFSSSHTSFLPAVQCCFDLPVRFASRKTMQGFISLLPNEAGLSQKAFVLMILLLLK